MNTSILPPKTHLKRWGFRRKNAPRKGRNFFFWDEAGTACFQRLLITYMARKSLEGNMAPKPPSLGIFVS